MKLALTGSTQALSVDLRQRTLDGALRNCTSLSAAVDRAKVHDAARLRSEYERLLGGLRERGALPGGMGPLPAGEDWLANPALPDDVLREAVCGLGPILS